MTEKKPELKPEDFETEPDIAYRERILFWLRQEIAAAQAASGNELDEIGDAIGMPRNLEFENKDEFDDDSADEDDDDNSLFSFGPRELRALLKLQQADGGRKKR